VNLRSIYCVILSKNFLFCKRFNTLFKTFFFFR